MKNITSGENLEFEDNRGNKRVWNYVQRKGVDVMSYTSRHEFDKTDCGGNVAQIEDGLDSE